MHETDRVQGTAGDDFLETTRGGVVAFDGDDTIHVTAMAGVGQIHTYAGTGDDLTLLDFGLMTEFSHGHHVRGAAGADVFDFRNLHNVQSTVVGRIEDFDSTRDTIMIDGVALDFDNLPSNVRLVEYAGALGEHIMDPQQWLLIDTGQGQIFYALEGARQDMSNEIAQEGHFLLEVPNFDDLVDVSFVDPVNYIPSGYAAGDGVIIEDNDIVRDDVLELIEGSGRGDLISAGLNDDTIYAHGGHDTVWGGSGNDAIWGGHGADLIHGGTGADRIDGGTAGDVVFGEAGDDLIFGGNGWDHLEGGDGNDMLDGGHGEDVLRGGAGNDVLEGGAEDDVLNGDAGQDLMTGGAGADVFVFDEFDFGFDVIGDFEIGLDHLQFGGAIESHGQIITMDFFLGGHRSVLVGFDDGSGQMDQSMGGVILWGVHDAALGPEHFIF